MRESQMKKLVALAVAGAFVAPVYAADITISGDQEFTFTDTNGTTATAIDGDFNIKASTTTANGLKVSADINVAAVTAGSDGGDSLTIAGPFGKVDLGETSSAADAFNGRYDFSYKTGVSTSAPDAAIGWSLPSFVPGLSVYISAGADSDFEFGNENHTGVALQYATGPVSISYGQNSNDDNSKITNVGASVKFAGLTAAVETMEDETVSTATKVDERGLGIKYTMGDVALYLATEETKTGGVVSADVTAMGVSYALGGGVVAFFENSSDDRNSARDTTALGVTFKF
jgi:hypothetical protein